MLNFEDGGQMVSPRNTALAALLGASFGSRGILYPVETTLGSLRENKATAAFLHSQLCFLARMFDVSTDRFKHAFTNLTENILLVGAEKVQISIFFFLFLKSPNLPAA